MPSIELKVDTTQAQSSETQKQTAINDIQATVATIGEKYFPGVLEDLGEILKIYRGEGKNEAPEEVANTDAGKRAKLEASEQSLAVYRKSADKTKGKAQEEDAETLFKYWRLCI